MAQNATGNAIQSAYIGSPKVVVNPSGDTTGTKDTAAINAVAQSQQAALLVSGTYYVKNLLVDTLGAIIGQGDGTILSAVSGTTGYVIALKHPASTYQVTLSNFTIVATSGTSLGGVQLDNTGYTGGGGGPSQQNDTLHTLDNVYVVGASGDGFHLDNNIRSLRMFRCTAYDSGGNGVYVGVGCTDSSFVGCIVGVATLHCWNFNGWNNYVASCKGFFGGNNGTSFDTTHSCWMIGTNASYNTFASCSAQNGGLHGWDLQACIHNAFVGCESDTNNQGNPGAGSGVGFNTNGVTYSTIIGCTGNNSGGPGQLYGIQVAGTQTNTSFVGNTVTGSVGPFSYVSGGGYFFLAASQADLSGVPTVKLPSTAYNNLGAQALSNNSTIATNFGGIGYGILPVTETGNVTGIILATPLNTNSQVTVVNESAFTVTFAASGTSNVADGVSDVIPALTARTFTYDSDTNLWYRSA